MWGNQFVQEAVALLGDNTGALQDALHLKGRGILAAVARELSWRKARYGWEFEVGHVPGELNTVPDALSRLHEMAPRCSRSPFVGAYAVSRHIWITSGRRGDEETGHSHSMGAHCSSPAMYVSSLVWQ